MRRSTAKPGKSTPFIYPLPNFQRLPPSLLHDKLISAHSISSTTVSSCGITTLLTAMPLVVWTAVLPLICYIVYTTYTNRARINRLRKAGYVSLPTNYSKT
jgi:hypothetical protein